ncbi:hypothetical protein FOZ63_014096 [Perkinsus olseni]|uniref:Uncharacterized protein n=1 Tax=Perkinsus olseni TaxID=32597 RepID=A0A7J6UNK3_PEROL|nr:hypothetical protein FOZ63_014096 [Perkinsus olseni]
MLLLKFSKLPRSGWDYFDHHVQGPLLLQPVKTAHLHPEYLVEAKESTLAELAAFEDREEATISPTDDLPKLDPEGHDITDEWGNGTRTPDDMNLEDMEWLRGEFPASDARRKRNVPRLRSLHGDTPTVACDCNTAIILSLKETIEPRRGYLPRPAAAESKRISSSRY